MNIQSIVILTLIIVALLLWKRETITTYFKDNLLINIGKTTYINSVIVLGCALFFGLSYLGTSLNKALQPTKKERAYIDNSYIMSDEEAAAHRASYEKEKATSDSIKLTNIASIENVVFCSDLDLIPTYINNIKENASTIKGSKDGPLKEKAIRALKAYQATNFPAARKLYYQNAKEKLWRKNIEVEMKGRSITFIGGDFALNAVKEDTYQEIRQELEDLRFTDVGFKCYSVDERTYWKLNSKNDSEI